MLIPPHLVYPTAAVACAAIAGTHDIRTRRIPNNLTGPAILCGLAMHFALGGAAELGRSCVAGIIAGALFLIFFVVGGMGAGDVKLMAAIGCLSGMTYIGEIVLGTVIAGAAIALALALHRRILRETLANVLDLVLHHSIAGMRRHPELNIANPETVRLPYAVPIAIGCTFTLISALAKGTMQ